MNSYWDYELDPAIVVKNNPLVVNSYYASPDYPGDRDVRVISVSNTNNTYNLLNEARSSTATNYLAAQCSKIIFTTDEPVIELVAGQIFPNEYSYIRCNLLRNVDTSKYGGNTYTARTYNSYIGFSDVVPISTSSVVCKYGDVYSQFLTFIRSLLYNPDNSYTFQEVVSIPVTSPIDLRYRIDRINEIIPNSESWVDRDKSYAIQETDGGRVIFY